MNDRARSLLRDAAVIAILAVITLVETFPAWLALRHPAAGFRIHDHFNDVAVIHWDLWWMREAVVSLGVNPFDTPLMFHPEGVNLFLTPFVPLFGLVSIPLQAVVPGPAGVVWADNLLTVLSFFLCAWFMVLFLRELGLRRVPALLAALPFAFAPFRFMHFARLHYLSSFWLPLYALCLLRFLDRGSRRSLVGATLIGLASLLSDHHHLIFLLFIAVAWVGYRLLRPVVARAILLRRCLACALLQAAVLAPVLVWCADGLTTGDSGDLQARLHFERTAAGRPTEEHLLLAPDFSNLGYILFPHLHAALGAGATPAPASTSARAAPEAAASNLPYRELHHDVCLVHSGPRGWRLPPLLLSILLVLVLVYALTRVQRAGKWVWVTLCMVALAAALGPTRLLFDTPVPMPFRALALLVPPLKASRYPAAFVLLALFAAAPLLAYGFQALLDRPRVGKATLLVTVTLLALAGVSAIYRPLRFDPPPAAAVYQALADDPEPGAVVELPLGNILLWRQAMAGQILHGRPIAEGGVTRAGPRARRFLDHDPLMRSLRDPPPPNGLPTAATVDANRATLLAAGFRYILVHHARFESAAKLERSLDLVRAHRPTRERTLGTSTVFLFDGQP